MRHSAALPIAWQPAREGIRRGATLILIVLSLVVYTVLIYGGVLTGTAAYWCSDIAWTLFALIAAVSVTSKQIFSGGRLFRSIC